MNKKNLAFIITVCLVLIMPALSQAAVPDQIALILTRIKTLFFLIFDGLVVIMCVYAAILYLTARGEPGKIQKANQALVWAAIGIAVGLLANFASGIVAWLIGL